MMCISLADIVDLSLSPRLILTTPRLLIPPHVYFPRQIFTSSL